MKYFTMQELDYISKELMENPTRETLNRLNNKYNGEGEVTKNLQWVESPAVGLEQSNNDNYTNINIPINSYNDDIIKNEDISSQTPIFNSSNNGQLEQQEHENKNIPNIPIFNDVYNMKSPVWEPVIKEEKTLFNDNVNNLMSKQNEPTINNSNNSLERPNLNTMGSSLNLNIPNIQEHNANINQNNMPSIELPKVNDNISEVNSNIPFNGNLWENQNNGLNNMMQTTDNFNSTIEQNQNGSVSSNYNPFFQTVSNQVNNQIPISEPPTVEGPTMFGQFEHDFNNNAA